MVKYADSVVKGFASSLAIIIGCILSMFFFDFQPTFQFLFGATPSCLCTVLLAYRSSLTLCCFFVLRTWYVHFIVESAPRWAPETRVVRMCSLWAPECCSGQLLGVCVCATVTCQTSFRAHILVLLQVLFWWSSRCLSMPKSLKSLLRGLERTFV